MTEVTAYHTEHHNQFDLIYAQTLIAGPSGLQLPSVVSPDGISWSVSAGSHLSGAPGSIVESLLEAFSDGQNTEDTLSAGLGSVVEPAFAVFADEAYLHPAKELAQVGSAVYGVWQGCEEMFSKLTTPLAPVNSTTFCVAGPTDPSGLKPPQFDPGSPSDDTIDFDITPEAWFKNFEYKNVTKLQWVKDVGCYGVAQAYAGKSYTGMWGVSKSTVWKFDWDKSKPTTELPRVVAEISAAINAELKSGKWKDPRIYLMASDSFRLGNRNKGTETIDVDPKTNRVTYIRWHDFKPEGGNDGPIDCAGYSFRDKVLWGMNNGLLEHPGITQWAIRYKGLFAYLARTNTGSVILGITDGGPGTANLPKPLPAVGGKK